MLAADRWFIQDQVVVLAPANQGSGSSQRQLAQHLFVFGDEEFVRHGQFFWARFAQRATVAKRLLWTALIAPQPV